jgi:hypothetical protein
MRNIDGAAYRQRAWRAVAAALGARLAVRGSLGGIVHPLLGEPTVEQKYLLDLIYRGRGLASSANERRWPVFQYVEQELYRQHELDVMQVLPTCPMIGGPASGGSYGWTWCSTRQADDEIRLTIAGMGHVSDAQHEVKLFIDALAVVVQTQRSFKASPTEVKAVAISVAEMRDSLPPVWRLDTAALAGIRDAFKHEPATWHCNAQPVDDWVLTLSPFLRQYGGLDTWETYLERVIEVLSPPIPQPEPLYPSPLSLPEAIDYLNAVWRLHAERPVIRIGRAEAAAKLVLDCATADEFESRLSALCSTLDALDVPDSDGHKLTDLNAYLRAELGEDASADRASEAIGDLRALFDLRVWRQHSGTERRAAAGMSRLGIVLPVLDWAEAWQKVQARTVAALAALREEVETLAPS